MFQRWIISYFQWKYLKILNSHLYFSWKKKRNIYQVIKEILSPFHHKIAPRLFEFSARNFPQSSNENRNFPLFCDFRSIFCTFYSHLSHFWWFFTISLHFRSIFTYFSNIIPNVWLIFCIFFFLGISVSYHIDVFFYTNSMIFNFFHMIQVNFDQIFYIFPSFLINFLQFLKFFFHIPDRFSLLSTQFFPIFEGFQRYFS